MASVDATGAQPAVLAFAGRTAVAAAAAAVEAEDKAAVVAAAEAACRSGGGDAVAADPSGFDIAGLLGLPAGSTSRAAIISRLEELPPPSSDGAELDDEISHVLAVGDDGGIAPHTAAARVETAAAVGGAGAGAASRKERAPVGGAASSAAAEASPAAGGEGGDVDAAAGDGSAAAGYVGPAIGSRAKTAWPELLGADVDAAVAAVEAERPDMLMVTPTPEGRVVATDVMAARRVRVWFDPATRTVSRVPAIG